MEAGCGVFALGFGTVKMARHMLQRNTGGYRNPTTKTSTVFLFEFWRRMLYSHLYKFYLYQNSFLLRRPQPPILDFSGFGAGLTGRAGRQNFVGALGGASLQGPLFLGVGCQGC